MAKPAEQAKQLFSGQTSLPSLPVPELEETLPKYLRTTLPLHQTQESLRRTEQAVESALHGKDAPLVKKLQERLVHRAKNEGRESWLSEWWLSGAYMTPRDPLVPFVSYFYLHKSDPKVKSQVARGAQILKATLLFRNMVVDESLAPEKTKTGFLCMDAFKHLFNTCRIPQEKEDVCFTADPTKNNHVTIIRKGHFYELQLVNPVTNKALSVPEIEYQLDHIMNDKRSQEAPASPIGPLTSDTRDRWASARSALLAGPDGAQNKYALERIESSIIVMCLDDTTPVSLEERGWAAWMGNDGVNRFYDKQQLIVAANATSGFIGEHSMLDGTHTLRLNNFVLHALEQGKIDLEGPSSGAVLDHPVYLEIKQEPGFEKRTLAAKERFAKLMSEQAMAALDFQGYGKATIKAYKCSPDAWAQMAIQLAYFRLFNRVCATYEAAQTRKFKLGRTETIRSASVESKAFVEAMENPDASDAERLQAFQQAAAQHIKYAKGASEAHGVDRHLLGLKKLLKADEEAPALFQDPMNAESSTWLLSTSQISTDVFDSWGFGEVTPKGYGCAYAIKENSLAFTLVCLKAEHNPVRLTEYLNKALLDIRAMHDRAGAGPSAKM